MSFRIHRSARNPPVNATLELRPTLLPRPMISLAIFDFDGTLSWLRHGWPQLMLETFLERAPESFGLQAPVERENLLAEIYELAGQPTIFQCESLIERLTRRGGPELEAESLLAEYEARLGVLLARRMEQVRSGASPLHAYLLHGTKLFLEHLAETGLKTAIVSSTAEERVREEAALLGLTAFFGDNIFGRTGEARAFTKRGVFERLMQAHGVPGLALLAFGDGPVELREAKALGGAAIGVCSDERRNGSGQPDPLKRTVLFAAGADATIPDYRDAPQLHDFLLGK